MPATENDYPYVTRLDVLYAPMELVDVLELS